MILSWVYLLHKNFSQLVRVNLLHKKYALNHDILESYCFLSTIDYRRSIATLINSHHFWYILTHHHPHQAPQSKPEASDQVISIKSCSWTAPKNMKRSLWSPASECSSAWWMSLWALSLKKLSFRKMSLIIY